MVQQRTLLYLLCIWLGIEKLTMILLEHYRIDEVSDTGLKERYIPSP